MSNNFANIDFLGQALELEACARVTESQHAERAMSRAARTLRDTLDYVGERKKRLKERDDYAESLRANNYELEQQLSEAVGFQMRPLFLAPPLPNVDEALYSATNIATYMARKFYPTVSKWQPLNDLCGVLSQIDNMAAGIAPPTAIPEGYVLVPKVPTEAMYQAGRNAPCVAEDDDWREDYKAVWQAMIAAGEKK